MLDVAPITVKRDWTLAKAWLYHDLQGTPDRAVLFDLNGNVIRDDICSTQEATRLK